MSLTSVDTNCLVFFIFNLKGTNKCFMSPRTMSSQGQHQPYETVPTRIKTILSPSNEGRKHPKAKPPGIGRKG